MTNLLVRRSFLVRQSFSVGGRPPTTYRVRSTCPLKPQRMWKPPTEAGLLQPTTYNLQSVSGGFTLTEILLTVAALTIIVSFSAPLFGSFQSRSDLTTTTLNAVHALRRAQELARASDRDTPWGVRFATTSLILFKGPDFSARDSSLDEIFELSPNLTVTQTNEIIFQKYSGYPFLAATTTIVSSVGETVNLHVNLKGAIIY